MFTNIMTALVSFGIGLFLFACLAMSLDGWNWNQAAPYLISYFVWILLCSFLAAFLSAGKALGLEEKYSMSSITAGFIVIILCGLLGGIGTLIGLYGEVYLIELLS